MKYWDKTLLQCHYICQFSHMIDLGLYLDIRGEKQATTKPEPYFILYHTPLTMYKEQIIFHLFLMFGTSFRWVVCFTFWQLYPSQGVGVELYISWSVCLLDLVFNLSTGQPLWSWYKHKHGTYLTNRKHNIN